MNFFPRISESNIQMKEMMMNYSLNSLNFKIRWNAHTKMRTKIHLFTPFAYSSLELYQLGTSCRATEFYSICIYMHSQLWNTTHTTCLFELWSLNAIAEAWNTCVFSMCSLFNVRIFMTMYDGKYFCARM